MFDSDQQERVIFENHERQIELKEIRKRLKEVCVVLSLQIYREIMSSKSFDIVQGS
jgi:hypothetical protein